MTKRPRYAATPRLSKVCRWILALGIMKLCVLMALVAGYPLPELSLDSEKPERREEQKPTAKTGLTAEIAPSVLESAENVLEKPAVATAQPAFSPSAPQPAPQGSAAARAAALVRPKHKATNADPAARPSGGLPLADSPERTAEKERVVQNDDAWWGNILQLKSLPFPRLGLDQAAHAATLDAPPPPSISAGGGNSPFTPPDAVIPRGQNPDGSPLPPRSPAARPLPSGTAGPQMNASTGLPAVLTPSNAPPPPRVDAYIPPEDPNRKQEELARREQDVLMLKQQMEQRLEELHNAERKVQDMLREAKELEEKKLSSLIAMYTNMKPKQAARAIESLDERVAAKILSGMSPKQSGDVLSYVDPTKTAKLTELLSRMRIGQ